MIQSTRIFEYLKTKNLGDSIRIQGDDEPEEVILLRRGRQNIRVKKPGGESGLVSLDQVIEEIVPNR